MRRLALLSLAAVLLTAAPAFAQAPSDADLQKAVEAFEVLDTPLWAQRAREDLKRASGVRKRSELTASEQRVAELAAEGATNREMAAVLFISPKTVETNLSRIYRKLNIRSRAELGRVMGSPDR